MFPRSRGDKLRRRRAAGRDASHLVLFPLSSWICSLSFPHANFLRVEADCFPPFARRSAHSELVCRSLPRLPKPFPRGSSLARASAQRPAKKTTRTNLQTNNWWFRAAQRSSRRRWKNYVELKKTLPPVKFSAFIRPPAEWILQLDSSPDSETCFLPEFFLPVPPERRLFLLQTSTVSAGIFIKFLSSENMVTMVAIKKNR